MYYKEAVGAMVVFDVTRVSTFEAVQKWKSDIDAKVTLPPDERPIPVVLLANKVPTPASTKQSLSLSLPSLSSRLLIPAAIVSSYKQRCANQKYSATWPRRDFAKTKQRWMPTARSTDSLAGIASPSHAGLRSTFMADLTRSLLS